MVADGEFVFAVFFKSVFLVEANGAFVFAEDTDVDFGGLLKGELVEGPGHEKVAEAVAEEGLTDVDLPDFHGVGEWVFRGDVDRADFDKGDEFVLMFDDLVTRGVSEPYRMFTSRAEYRLTLRADNADQRLTGMAQTLGLSGATRNGAFAAKLAELEGLRSRVSGLSLTPNEAAAHGVAVNADGKRRSVSDLLAYPDVGWARICEIWPELAGASPAVAEQIEIDALYAGYIDRQQADILAFRKDEAVRLPRDLDYRGIGGLSNEAREKLETARPETLGQAARIEGVTPGALTAVLAHVKRRDREAS